ncbi:MAG TPA: glycosyltransferase family 2 protein [Candidatus Hydrogenedentes bacterium]|nr:glycosyltransferase family 2 protein [Candidatus Hydrogenedentota bacterium]
MICGRGKTGDGRSSYSGLAAVVPCYNAGDRVRGVVAELAALLEHVFVVDDGSTDGAVADLRDFPAEIITFPENRGKGHAMLEGFRAALAIPAVRCVAILDADGQHDPAELGRLYRAFEDNDADLVIGSRVFDQQHVPWRSRFGNKLTIAVTARLLGQRIPDTQSGYRLHSRRLLENVVATLTGGRYETEMAILVKALQEDYTVVPVPIQTIYEKGNPSSHFNNLRDSLRIYSSLFHGAFRRK